MYSIFVLALNSLFYLALKGEGASGSLVTLLVLRMGKTKFGYPPSSSSLSLSLGYFLNCLVTEKKSRNNLVEQGSHPRSSLFLPGLFTKERLQMGPSISNRPKAPFFSYFISSRYEKRVTSFEQENFPCLFVFLTICLWDKILTGSSHES